MAAGLEVRGGPDVHGSDGSPPDRLLPFLVELISRISKSCCHQIPSEGAVSVESVGDTIAGSWSFPGFSLCVAGHYGDVSFCYRRVMLVLCFVSGQLFMDIKSKLVASCTPSTVKMSSRLEQDENCHRDGAHSLSVRWQVHRQSKHWHSFVAIQDQFLEVLLACNGMESTVLLQVMNLHMVVGVTAPVPHFSD